MGPRIKKTVTKKMQKTKEKVVSVINQARESLKLLELLEREKLAKAGRRITDETIHASLRKLGIAAISDLNELRDEMKRLESEILKLKSSSFSHDSGTTTLQNL